MKPLKFSIVLLLLFLMSERVFAQRIENFSLSNAKDGQVISFQDLQKHTAIVLVFTGLNCPFSKLYEDRLIALHEQFSSQDIFIALVNPLVGVDEEESEEKILARMNSKQMKFPFLLDYNQSVSRSFEITKLPEVVVITNSPTGSSIAYRGAIDNNPQLAANANIKYLENALNSIVSRRNPSPASSRPVGCNLRYSDF